MTSSLGLSGCVSAIRRQSPSDRVEQFADDLRRFEDVSAALEEGYRTTGTYVQNNDGVLGIPFVNFDRTDVDPRHPQAVLYGLDASGQYHAIGLKWFVSTESHGQPPSLFGKEFDGPFEGDTPIIPRHYALHVWLFRDNPNGMFAYYNPSIVPPDLVDHIRPVRAALRDYVTGVTATEETYTNTEQCISTPDGGYGIPFVKKDLDGRGGTDPKDPPVLLYRLSTDWSYQLSGVEWYVPTSATADPPTLFGREFHPAMTGHSPKTDQPDHYGLHAWLFSANPRGMFEPYNPAISC